MPKQIFRCDICKGEYGNEISAELCEEVHDNIEKQVNAVVSEIKKLYELGGSIELAIGSNEGNKLDCIGFRKYDGTMLIKNWTAHDYVNALFKVK